MAEAHLARSRPRPATDEPGVADGVVRGAERADRGDARTGWQQSRDAVNTGGLERLVQGHGRQDGREPAREHGLARAGRTNHEQVVAPSRRDLERAFGRGLASHVAEVCPVGVSSWRIQPGIPVPKLTGAAGECAHLRQGGRPARLDALHDGGLRGVGSRKHHPAATQRTRAERHRERAPHRAQVPFEAELAHDDVAIEPARRELPAGEENAECDREVERGAGLGPIRGREVARDPLEGEGVAGARERGRHALAALFHRALRQADRGEGGEPVGEVHLDLDGIRVDPDDGRGSEMGEHARSG